MIHNCTATTSPWGYTPLLLGSFHKLSRPHTGIFPIIPCSSICRVFPFHRNIHSSQGPQQSIDTVKAGLPRRVLVDSEVKLNASGQSSLQCFDRQPWQASQAASLNSRVRFHFFLPSPSFPPTCRRRNGVPICFCPHFLFHFPSLCG